jgi:hypothetical protein
MLQRTPAQYLEPAPSRIQPQLADQTLQKCLENGGF